MGKKNRSRESYQQQKTAMEAGTALNNPAPIDLTELTREEKREVLTNNLAAAIGFGGVGVNGFPQNQGSPYSEQISNATTMFVNMRWYLVSNFRQMLSEAYVEFGLIQTIVDVPVDDALRGGVEIKSKILSEDDIAELQGSLDRDDDLQIAGQAAKWNRLFGGGGILILTDQDPETELDLAAIGPDDTLEFRAVDMWELFWDKQNTEGYDPAIQSQEFEFYNYYGEQVHKSRVMRLTGKTAPSFIRPRLRGWGFSVVEALVRSINQYLKATDLSFEVLDEFKLDVYKIKNLVDTLLSPIGQQKVRERVQMANWQKNYQNALVMDSEDDYDHKQLSFSGLGEVMAGIRMQVASDMRMPLTKLFGISAAGFNSGEDDIEVYNGMVESEVRNKIKYHILRMIEIKCQKLFGFVPDDLSIEFKPLRVLGGEQEQNVKNSKFTRLLQAFQSALITAIEFREACNKGGLMDILLDTKNEIGGQLDGYMDDTIVEGENDPDDPKDVDNPGADRADSQKALGTQKGGISKEPANYDKVIESPAKPPKPSKGSRPAPSAKDAPKVKADSRATLQETRANKVEKIRTTNSATWVSTPHGIQHLPAPYSRLERVMRTVSNSVAFDKASYAADGGDKWLDIRRKYFFDRDKAKDKQLWDKATEAAKAAGQTDAFTIWWYKKQGGKF